MEFSLQAALRVRLFRRSCTTNPKILCRLGKNFFRVFLGAHASSVPRVSNTCTLEACAPRDDLRVLRVSAVRFFWLRLRCSVQAKA